jgi:hypothetical protein
MMMVILTKPEAANPMLDRNRGPLRQMFDDMNNLNRRMHSMEQEIRALASLHQERSHKEAYEAYKWDDLNRHNLLNTASLPPLKFDSVLSAELAKRMNGGKI